MLVKHYQGRNYKSISFNHECWLMLLIFLIDFWDQYCIENTIASFGHLISWEMDYCNMARLILKACVIDLEKVPAFIVLTEGEGYLGQCNAK
jgi:hypothetical protein